MKQVNITTINKRIAALEAKLGPLLEARREAKKASLLTPKIMQLLESNKQITAKQVKKLTGADDPKVSYHLRKLIAAGMLKKVGHGVYTLAKRRGRKKKGE